MKKLTIISLIVFVVLIVGVIYWTSASSPQCANAIEKEVYSPSRLKKAVVFVRDCGVTTSFSTQISVLNASEKLPNESGNTLVSRDVLHFGPGHDIYWFNDNELVIEYNFTAEATFKKDFVEGVKILYKNSMLPGETGKKK